MSGANPELLRVYVAFDHKIKAVFSDNSLVLVGSSGGAFIHCSPTGGRVRQLSDYAVSRYAEKLSKVLEFRNMHLPDPFYCRWAKKQKKEKMLTTACEIRSVRWPNSVQEGLRAGLIHENPDGSIELKSEEGYAQVVLDASLRRFTVCFPARIHAESVQGKCEYVWQKQVFPVNRCPARWGPAIQILQAAHRSLEGGLGSQTPDDACDHDLGMPGYRDTATEVSQSSLERTSQLPCSSTSSPQCAILAQFPENSWWFEPTVSLLPSTGGVLIEWTPEAVYQYIPDTQEVEVWVHSDASCLATHKQGRFLRHIRAPHAEDRTYAASAVPRCVWSVQGDVRYSLADIAKHAFELRSVSSQTCPPAASVQQSTTKVNISPQSVISNSVKEEQEVAGYGTFTAYVDGRVRVKFEDRTLVTLDSSHENCTLTLSSGRRLDVRTDNPVGVEDYVQVCMEFANWAFQTQAERNEVARMRVEIQEMAEQCKRAAIMCEWATTGEFPQNLVKEIDLDDRGQGVVTGRDSEAWGAPRPEVDWPETEDPERMQKAYCDLSEGVDYMASRDMMVQQWLDRNTQCREE